MRIRSTWNRWRTKQPNVDWRNLIWFPGHIPKFTTIVWLAIKRILSTSDRLLNFGLLSDSKCVVRNFEESQDYLFFECCFSSTIWKSLQDKCEVRWPARPRENWVSDMPDLCKGKSLRAKLIECPTSCVYAIWQERNCRIFKGSTNPVEVVKVNTENNIRNRILSFNLSLMG